MAGRLTVVAGAGPLVTHVVDAALNSGYKVQVLSLVPRPDITQAKVVAADVANPLAIIWSLKVFRTTHIVLAGAIQLPDRAREGLIKFAASNGDAGTRPNSSMPVGDATLSAIGSVLKKMTGADLVGAHEIAPDLLTPAGRVAGPALSEDATASARFALGVARGIGALDIGQAAVVSGLRVVAVEDIGGTDALIARAGQLKREGLVGDGAAPMILAKAIKPQQPAFVDLPAIGAQTVIGAAAAGISVIVAEAQKSIVLERPALIAEADRLGVSVVGLADN